MPLILFAQTCEADPTIQKLNAKAQSYGEVYSEGHVATYYTFDGGAIAITSIGLHAASATLAKHAHEYDEIWNFGFAGALNDQHELGTLIPIRTIRKYVPVELHKLDSGSRKCLENTLPEITIAAEGASLISSDFPLHNNERKQQIPFDLIDMEGYAIAYTANHLGKKCSMWKIVSDFASEGGRELIRQNKQCLAEKIATRVYESCTHP